MVVCQPGTNDVAKSIDTIECTDNTSGVEIPARINEIISYLCQVRVEPFQPIEKKLYTNLRTLVVALSLMEAISGIKPMYQNTNETEKYVEIANTSHTRGELKLTHNEPNALGSGTGQ